MLAFPQPHYMPCTECGASIASGQAELHACEQERRLDFLVLQLRDERERFDAQFTAYLDSPRGRFESWYAALRR